MDLHRCGITPTIDAAQGDELSRTLEITLYDDGKDFLLPENLAVIIRYKKADGKGGEYDTLPDNTPAWYACENKLTIALVPQVLTFPGYVSMTVTLVSEGTQISTFPLGIHVLPEARGTIADSDNYFRVSGFLVAPGNASEGQYLKISSVNDAGRVTAVEAGSIQQAPSDWNAAPGQPGHILNRPFYCDTEAATVILPPTQPIYDESDNMFALSDPLELTAGQMYIVSWNGAEYHCTAWAVPMGDGITSVGLGDRDMVESGTPGTGEPFAVVALPSEYVATFGAGVMILPIDGTVALTLSIFAVTEKVIPIPEKYLGNLKAQKNYTIDLDNSSADVSLSTLMNMDPGELQACVTVLYEGTEHGVSVTAKEEESVNGITLQALSFAFLHGPGTAHPRIVRFRWSNFNGMEIGPTSNTVPEIIGSHLAEDTVFYSRVTGSEAPTWNRMRDIRMNGIRLNSSTPGSNKQFWITVDDSGTLNATLSYL